MFNSALPTWWNRGADRQRGGWRDQLAQDGSVPKVQRRARVQARQTYVYALAGDMGWRGPWREAAQHGLDYLMARYSRGDGLFRTRVDELGAPADDTAALYDQAFVLLAMAALRRAAPDHANLEPDARRLLDIVRAEFGHQAGGFRENSLDRPFQSNPQMHLLEASLAWRELSADQAWTALAGEIAELCLARFIDPETGALREFFDEAWRPAQGASGRIVEPGHQFEWAWLLQRWADASGRAEFSDAARRLFEVGLRHGVDSERGVAINALTDDLQVHDCVARLWPQTERVKAAVSMAEAVDSGPERDSLLEEAGRGVRGLRLYLRTPLQGLWYDRLGPDGSVVEEPAPASSFYHIACAIDVLHRFTDRR